MGDRPDPAEQRSWLGTLSEGEGVTGWLEGSTLWLVRHNQHRGSAKLAATVAAHTPDELTADLQGAELVVQGEVPERFQAIVVDADPRMILLSVFGPAPSPVRVQYRGGPDQFEARGRSGSWQAEELGVTDERIANRLNDKLFQPLEQVPGAPGHWLLDAGSLDDFIASVQHSAAEAEQRRQRHQAQRQRQRRAERRDSHFINPYTFVPLPAGGPARDEPPGHDRCDATRPMVRIRLTWEARTPLATGAPYRHLEGRWGLAGSAVKGAVRSLHEALTGSCLRIVDLEAAVSHREPMSAGRDDRRLARVDKVSEPSGSGERTLTLQLARRTVWVDSEQLPVPVASGEPCDVSGVKGSVDFIDAFGRYQLRPDPEGAPELAGDPGMVWVPLLSSTGARSGHRYYVALGAFPAEPDGRDLVRVSSRDPAWRHYEQAAAGTDDERVRRHGGTPDLEVRWPQDRIVGTRQPVRYALDGRDAIEPGHLLWATLDAGRVTHLAAAYVWRRAAEQPVRQRLPEGAGPCTDPARLCLSCQVFGSGGERGADWQDGDAGHGYRGHVRFASMLTDAAPEQVQLAPLNAAPRLSAGQFYLEEPAQRHAGRGGRALREWGSAADSGGPRRLRGRKFYWPADPAAQQDDRGFPAPRWRAEQGPYRQHRERGQPAYVWPAGTAFTQTVTVVGLDPGRLGGLLAALRPDLLAGPTDDEWSRAVVRMGYGKPFGLGVLRATAVEVTVQTPADRYGPRPGPRRPVPDDELAGWVAQFAQSAPDEVRATWPDLRAVTDPDHVWPEYVTYPVDRWEDYPHERDRGGGDYQFRFWRESIGDHRYPLVSLPPAREQDQLLPLRPSREDEG